MVPNRHVELFSSFLAKSRMKKICQVPASGASKSCNPQLAQRRSENSSVGRVGGKATHSLAELAAGPTLFFFGTSSGEFCFLNSKAFCFSFNIFSTYLHPTGIQTERHRRSGCGRPSSTATRCLLARERVLNLLSTNLD